MRHVRKSNTSAVFSKPFLGIFKYALSSEGHKNNTTPGITPVSQLQRRYIRRRLVDFPKFIFNTLVFDTYKNQNIMYTNHYTGETEKKKKNEHKLKSEDIREAQPSQPGTFPTVTNLRCENWMEKGFTDMTDAVESSA